MWRCWSRSCSCCQKHRNHTIMTKLVHAFRILSLSYWLMEFSNHFKNILLTTLRTKLLSKIPVRSTVLAAHLAEPINKTMRYEWNLGQIMGDIGSTEAVINILAAARVVHAVRPRVLPGGWKVRDCDWFWSKVICAFNNSRQSACSWLVSSICCWASCNTIIRLVVIFN
jgi:hypothetical protein